jgi:ribosomal protein S10
LSKKDVSSVAIVRKVVEGSQLAQIIELPAEMKNTKVELIIRPFIEKKEIETFDPKRFRGILNIKNVEEQIEQIRNDWVRQ